MTQFEQYVKDNDSKRAGLLKRSAELTDENIALDDRISGLHEELEVLHRRRAGYLLELRRLEVFSHFIDKALGKYAEFEDAEDMMRRFQTLVDTRAALKERLDDAMADLEGMRKRIQEEGERGRTKLITQIQALGERQKEDYELSNKEAKLSQTLESRIQVRFPRIRTAQAMAMAAVAGSAGLGECRREASSERGELARASQAAKNTREVVAEARNAIHHLFHRIPKRRGQILDLGHKEDDIWEMLKFIETRMGDLEHMASVRLLPARMACSAGWQDGSRCMDGWMDGRMKWRCEVGGEISLDFRLSRGSPCPCPSVSLSTQARPLPPFAAQGAGSPGPERKDGPPRPLGNCPKRGRPAAVAEPEPAEGVTCGRAVEEGVSGVADRGGEGGRGSGGRGGRRGEGEREREEEREWGGRQRRRQGERERSCGGRVCRRRRRRQGRRRGQERGGCCGGTLRAKLHARGGRQRGRGIVAGGRGRC